MTKLPFQLPRICSNKNVTAVCDPSNPVAHALDRHVAELLSCERCPGMHRPVVSGGAVVSKVMLVGQAPGDKEPILKRPFAWTAGKTLFRWFQEACGLAEADFRSLIYMAAVCRCFPGKKVAGGDRVPSDEEIESCSFWLHREINILRPKLVIPVGKLAISRFMDSPRLDQVIGTQTHATMAGHRFDIIPLPHPSGASPWHRMEPGKTLLKSALILIAAHPAFRRICERPSKKSTKAQIASAQTFS